MEQQALQTAQNLTAWYIGQCGPDLIDSRTLMKAVIAGFLVGSGVPGDQVVQRVEQIAAPMLVSPVPPNPMYHGLPWMIPGPTSGAPYYR